MLSHLHTYVKYQLFMQTGQPEVNKEVWLRWRRRRIICPAAK